MHARSASVALNTSVPMLGTHAIQNIHSNPTCKWVPDNRPRPPHRIRSYRGELLPFAPHVVATAQQFD